MDACFKRPPYGSGGALRDDDTTYACKCQAYISGFLPWRTNSGAVKGDDRSYRPGPCPGPGSRPLMRCYNRQRAKTGSTAGFFLWHGGTCHSPRPARCGPGAGRQGRPKAGGAAPKGGALRFPQPPAGAQGREGGRGEATDNRAAGTTEQATRDNSAARQAGRAQKGPGAEGRKKRAARPAQAPGPEAAAPTKNQNLKWGLGGPGGATHEHRDARREQGRPTEARSRTKGGPELCGAERAPRRATNGSPHAGRAVEPGGCPRGRRPGGPRRSRPAQGQGPRRKWGCEVRKNGPGSCAHWRSSEGRAAPGRGPHTTFDSMGISNAHGIRRDGWGHLAPGPDTQPIPQ